MATRRERQAAARAAEEEAERRAEQEAAASRAKRRRWALLGGGGIAALALVGVLVLALGGGEDPQPAANVPAATAEDVAKPSLKELDALPQNGTVLGDPNAPYTLVEFGDLVCPGCKIYSEEILPRVIEQYVRTGQLRFELRPFGFVRDWSTPAAQYAWAAAEQDKLFDFVKAWYANQGAEDTDYVDDAFARRVASAVPGLDAEQLIQDSRRPDLRAKLDDVSRGFLTLKLEQVPAFAAGKTGEPVRPIDLGSSPQTASAALSQLMSAG